MGSRCVQFGVIALTLSYWSLEFQHGKELSEDLKTIIIALHKDGVGYKKIANTLRLSWLQHGGQVSDDGAEGLRSRVRKKEKLYLPQNTK